MDLTVSFGPPLRGRLRVPGDKSISHRALLLGAIGEGETRIKGFLPAADCLATLRCVQALGVEVERISHGSLLVHGRGMGGLQEPLDVLDCGGSGTTMRLLSGILAGRPFYSVLTGNAQLLRRPMGRIVQPLRRMGATILGRDGGRLPPLTIQGGGLRGIDYALPVASAQVKSTVLLAGLQAEGRTVVREPGPARDHTERMLAAMGADIRVDGRTIILNPRPSPLGHLHITVPGDVSSAAFFIVAACLIPRSDLTIASVGVNPTRTGLLEALRAMGADLTLENERDAGGEPVADVVARTSELRGVEVGGEWIPRLIDELPILAVAATQAKGRTVVRDAAELRVKETDRVATTVEELRKLGAEIEARPDGFIVEGPTELRGARVESHGDHRLAMSLAVAGLLARGETVVSDTECIADSFPGFERVLAGLRKGRV